MKIMLNTSHSVAGLGKFASATSPFPRQNGGSGTVWKSQSGGTLSGAVIHSNLYWLVVGGHTREILKSYYTQMLSLWLYLPTFTPKTNQM